MSKNVRDVALDCLLHIEKNQSYSNLLLNQMIQKHDMNRKDIGLLTEIVYGTIQRRDTLEFYITPFLKKPTKIQLWVRILLRLSLYQMVYLDRVPERAAIHEAVEIAKKRGHKGISGMVNGVLRSIQRQGLPSLETIKDDAERISIQTSHPLWLVKKWIDQYGKDETVKMCEINVTPPPVTARVNTNEITIEELILQLKEDGMDTEKGILSPDAITIAGGNLAHTNAFKEGLVTVQDESSMLVGRALDIQKGQSILDSCAAPGGKTTHIAERLNGTGKVISIDLHPHKVKLIEEQVSRLKLTNVETRVCDSRKLSSFFNDNSFDRILVDAPCTGFGVLRRKPDIKYSKQEKDIKNLAATQIEILQSVAPLLKDGGLLVYSTCTIDQEENVEVVERFLNDNPEFTLDPILSTLLPDKLQPFIKEGQVQILPHYFGTDGFYIATIRKQVK